MLLKEVLKRHTAFTMTNSPPARGKYKEREGKRPLALVV